MRINTNALAMNAARNLSANTQAVQSSIEKLSSGLRINRAADDAAGLVISEGMRAQVAGLGQAISNSNDGINMIKTAEGALNEVHSLLRSMRTLAVHAANTGVNNAGAVAADQAQFDSAVASINRIGSTSEFNGKKLFTGALGLGGVSANSTVADFVGGTGSTTAGTYTISVTTAAAQAYVSSAAAVTGVTTSSTATINGIQISSSGATVAAFVADINAAASRTGVTASEGSSGTITFTNVAFGNVNGPSVTLSGVTAGSTLAAATAGVDAVVTASGAAAPAQTTVAGAGQTATFANGLVVKATGAAAATTTVTVANNALEFQVGANAGQTANTTVNAMNANSLGVASLNLGSASGAAAAITAIDAAIDDISTRRSALGSFQKNVLESNVTSLGVAKENLAASESTIRDADMAAEMVTFTKNQILVQASQAMLAQANQSSQGILSLLRG